MFPSLVKPRAGLGPISWPGAVSRCHVALLFIFSFALLGISVFSSEAAQLGNKAKAPNPCRSITAINIQTGIVTASENATSRVFSFQVTNANLLHSLKVGQGVYANFISHQVSIDGRTACCAIVSISSPPAPAPQTGSVPSGKKPDTPQGRAAAGRSPLQTPPVAIEPKPGQPSAASANFGPGPSLPVTCCAVITINAQTRIAEGQENSNRRVFFFEVPTPALMNSLHVGQGIYANFRTKEVSLDGRTACCHITNIGAIPPTGGTALYSQQTASQVSPSNTSNKNKPATERRVDAAQNTLGPGTTVVQPAEPTTEVANRAAPAGAAGDPNPSSPQADKRDLRADNRDIRNDHEDLQNDRKDARREQRPEVVQPAEPTTEVANRGATAGGPPTPNTLTKLPAEKSGAARPPQLSFLGCTPTQVPSGTPIHCSIRLDTSVPGTLSRSGRGQAGAGIEVQVATDKPALAASSTVTLAPGTEKAEFQIPTVADAQGGPIHVSASYQGTTKNATLQLTPASIKGFACFVGATLSQETQGANTCAITPRSGQPYGLVVHLTQAQAQPVTLHLDPEDANVQIPAGMAWGGILYVDEAHSYFQPVPRTENHTSTLRDPVSGVSHSVIFNVLPASINGAGFGATLASAQNPITVNSLPGQDLTAWVSFNAPPAPTDQNSQNAWLDVVYGGPVDATRGSVAIQGPTNLAMREKVCTPNEDLGGGTYCSWLYPPPESFSFQITVGACSQAENPNGCQATVTVSSNQSLGRAVGIINVNPQ